MLFNPYQLQRDLDDATPVLVLLAAAVALDEALTERTLQPLADLAQCLLKGIFE